MDVIEMSSRIQFLGRILMSMRQGIALSVIAVVCCALTVAGGSRLTMAQPAPGGCWRVVPASNVNGAEANISRLVRTGDGELWAVSNNGFAQPGQSQPHVLRWNNTAWDQLPALPLTGTYGI